eukprot:gene4408-biopygen1908
MEAQPDAVPDFVRQTLRDILRTDEKSRAKGAVQWSFLRKTRSERDARVAELIDAQIQERKQRKYLQRNAGGLKVWLQEFLPECTLQDTWIGLGARPIPV